MAGKGGGMSDQRRGMELDAARAAHELFERKFIEAERARIAAEAELAALRERVKALIGTVVWLRLELDRNVTELAELREGVAERPCPDCGLDVNGIFPGDAGALDCDRCELVARRLEPEGVDDGQ